MNDKERIDWLESAMANEHPSIPTYQDGGWGYPYLISGTPSGGGVGFKRFNSLREAIDEAMKEH